MPKPKVFVTRIIPDTGSRLVEDFCRADIWQDELPPSHAELLRRVAGMNGLLCLLTDKVDAEVMDAAGDGLKVISNHAVGFDNIDVPEATLRRIPVGNTPGILTESTADFAFSLIAATARRVVEGDKFVHSGKWRTWGPSLLLGTDLHHATLGIVGFGRIGRALARRAVGFEMRVIYYDPDSIPGIKLIYIDPPFATKQEFRGRRTKTTIRKIVAACALHSFEHWSCGRRFRL